MKIADITAGQTMSACPDCGQPLDSVSHGFECGDLDPDAAVVAHSLDMGYRPPCSRGAHLAPKPTGAPAMDAQTATIVNAPSFAAAVETFNAWCDARQTGDQRTKAARAAVATTSRPAERKMRAVATETGVRVDIVQTVVMAAALVARDAR